MKSGGGFEDYIPEQIQEQISLQDIIAHVPAAGTSLFEWLAFIVVPVVIAAVGWVIWFYQHKKR